MQADHFVSAWSQKFSHPEFMIWERDLEDDPVTHDLVTRFFRGEIWSYLGYSIINHPFHPFF